jgi:hypothetical protein
MNKTGTIDGNSTSRWDSFLAYNMADVMLLKRIEELEYARWLAELKRRWGIFWRIPYWWHHGRPPVSHVTKEREIEVPCEGIPGPK